MDIIKQALKVMESDFKGGDWTLNSSERVKDFCRLQIGSSKDEVFSVLFLDNKLKNIDFKTFFCGTINECHIHLRPIVRHALECNAASIILVHNHPSGNCKPSDSDIRITKEFKDFFKQINCNVIDHIIVSPLEALSFRESGEFFGL